MEAQTNIEINKTILIKELEEQTGMQQIKLLEAQEEIAALKTKLETTEIFLRSSDSAQIHQKNIAEKAKKDVKRLNGKLEKLSGDKAKLIDDKNKQVRKIKTMREEIETLTYALDKQQMMTVGSYASNIQAIERIKAGGKDAVKLVPELDCWEKSTIKMGKWPLMSGVTVHQKAMMIGDK